MSNRIVSLFLRIAAVLIVTSGVAHSASVRPAEIQSIQISPAKVIVGTHPDITGSIKVEAVEKPATSLEVIVIVSVVRPDHVMRSWTWKNVLMRPGETKTFIVPKQYDIKTVGTYKVDFNVYSKDMRPLHRLSKTFAAVDEAQPSVTPKVPAVPTEPEAAAVARPSKKAAVPAAVDRHIGIGLYGNTFNGAGGATVLLWPFRHVGMQASYAVGANTIAEGRLLVRFPLSSGINPYAGAGYVSVSTERNVDVINIETEFKDSGVSGVVGVEMPLGKRVSGFLEVGAASIDLKKEVTNGTISGTATVDYAPVTIGIGIVYYLF